MQKAGKTVGTWLNKIVRSEEWKGIKNASRKLKTLPNELMREANLDSLGEEFSEFSKYRNSKVKVTMPADDYGAWGGKPTFPSTSDNTIAPPAADIESVSAPEISPASAEETDAQPEQKTDTPAQ
jgi:hypothetical protein